MNSHVFLFNSVHLVFVVRSLHLKSTQDWYDLLAHTDARDGLGFLDNAIKSILDLNFCAAVHLHRYLVPLRAHLEPEHQDLQVFLKSPLATLDLWVDSVYPSLTALSWRPLVVGTHSAIEFICNSGPFLRLLGLETVRVLLVYLCRYLSQDFSLLGCPSWLLATFLLDEEPSLLALLNWST